MLPRPVTLCILDGIGWGRRDIETDAVFAANTPTLDRWTNGGAAWTLLKAHGTAVGLPSDKDMGNSEVGHNAMGDGRDVAGRSALTWVRPLEEKLRGRKGAAIATGGGRMLVTMDRYEAEWSMVERGWHLHVGGEGRKFPSASSAIETLYAEDPKVD